MAAVRDFADELEGYAYLPRMFDKARARLSGDADAPPFGCPLDHSCLARLRVYPENVLELVSGNGDDDRAILGGLREYGIPPATEAWFDARATEDELLTGVYLKVRPRELLDELQPRPDQRVVASRRVKRCSSSATVRCGSSASVRWCACHRSCPIGSRTSASRHCASIG